jgi:transposase
MRKSRISQSKQDCLIEHFIAGTTARTAASLVGVHRNSASFYFHCLREVIWTCHGLVPLL